MRARIFLPPKTAMQSGRAGTHQWVLEFIPTEGMRPDALMGWSGGAGTAKQVRLKFATREAAIAYAERQGLAFDIEEPQPRVIKPKAYADNFKFGRAQNWTH